MTNASYTVGLPNFTYAAFRDYSVASQAIAALVDNGIDKGLISVMLKDRPVNTGEGVSPIIEDATSGLSVTTAEDAFEGAAKGAGVGIGLGFLAGIASLVVPGVGLIIGGGALLTAIGGVVGTGAAGAFAGAITGYLIDQGVDALTVRRLAGKLEDGNIVVGVDAYDAPSRDLVHSVLAKYEEVEASRA